MQEKQPPFYDLLFVSSYNEFMYSEVANVEC